MKSYGLLITIAVVIVGGYGTICFLTWLFQDKLIFYPFRDYEFTPASLGFDFEELSLSLETGDTDYGWYCRTTPEPRAVILFLNGNAGNISHRLERLPMARQQKADILFVDYPGYGRSTGKPSEEALYATAEAAYQFLVTKRGIEPDKIILFGESIGSAVALHLATRHKVGGVVVESGFTSLADVGASHFGWLPVRYLLKYQFSAKDLIKEITCPVMITHSPLDEVTPYWMGEELFRLAPEPKKFVTLSGYHNDREFLNDPAWLSAMAWLMTEVENRRPRPPSGH